MAVSVQKTTGDEKDILINGFTSIAASPHQGIGNLQNVNVDTEPGEVSCNFSRVQQSQPGDVSTTHTIVPLDSSHLTTPFTLINGSWITVSGSSISGLSGGNYYIQNSNGTPTVAATSFQISSTFGGTSITGFGNTGTATFTLTRVMGLPVQSATEEYTDASNNVQYRYYVLDQNGMLWVYDTALVATPVQGLLHWFLPDITNPDGNATLANGLAVYDGWVHLFKGNKIYCKLTALLGVNPTNTSTVGWATFTGGYLNTPPFSPNPHFALVAQGEIVYTDTNFVGTILALSNSGSPTSPNLFTYGSVTVTNANPSVFTLTPLNGQVPYVNQTVMFISSGTPTNVDPTVLYYIGTVQITSGGLVKFTISTSVNNGNPVASVTNTGTLYVNSYNPVNSAGEVTYAFSPGALLLPSNEIAQCLAQLGTNLVVGGVTATMYTWDFGASGSAINKDDQPTGFIFLPEANVQTLLTVNVVVYAFVGSKGNIYVTNGSSASLALSVPDYTAGIPGTPSSYFDPYFKFGGAAIIRGKVLFSLQDQTATKAGNCGGIWGFVPAFFNPVTGADTGTQLRMENTNSYGTLNGMSTIILPLQNQFGISPQFFSAWTSDQSSASATYGIDVTGTFPNTTAIIDCDLIPIGTLLDKKTFGQIEYKVASPLLVGESIQLYYRQNATDTWTTCGSVNEEISSQPSSQNRLSGWFAAPAQLGQWFQVQAHLIPNGTSTFSGNRLVEIRLR